MTAMKKPAAGDTYEAPSGLGFLVEAVEGDVIKIVVERRVRRDGQSIVEKNRIQRSLKDFELFARPYAKKKKT